MPRYKSRLGGKTVKQTVKKVAEKVKEEVIDKVEEVKGKAVEKVKQKVQKKPLVSFIRNFAHKMVPASLTKGPSRRQVRP